MPLTLKITNKTGVTLYDSAWTAGVDCVAQSQEDIEDKADPDFDQKPTKKIGMITTGRLTEGIDEDVVNPRNVENKVAEQEKHIADNPADDPQLPDDSKDE